MTPLPPAIVLGIDSPIGLTVLRELGMRGVPVHGVGRPRSIGRASRYCTSFTLRPEEQPAEWLPALIQKTGAKALLAIGEQDLLALSALPERIGECQILTPRAGPLGSVLDKRETLRRAAALGIDTPESWCPVSGEDFAAKASSLVYPVVVKWADPARMAPLLLAHDKPFHKTEFAANDEALLALLRRYDPIEQWPLVQSYCPGYGLGQMLHMANGRATMAFQHRRLHEWPPEGGVSTWCAAEPLHRHQRQRSLSEALLRTLDWQGPAMVEYRFDPRTDRYWLMEVNGRFWGSLPLASHSGATFAWESYRRAILGQTDPAPPPLDDRRARYMIPETRRLLRILFQQETIADPAFIRRPLRELLDYVLAFFDPRTRYYVFCLRDLRPSLTDIAAIIRKAVRRENPAQG